MNRLFSFPIWTITNMLDIGNISRWTISFTFSWTLCRLMTSRKMLRRSSGIWKLVIFKLYICTSLNLFKCLSIILLIYISFRMSFQNSLCLLILTLLTLFSELRWKLNLSLLIHRIFFFIYSNFLSLSLHFRCIFKPFSSLKSRCLKHKLIHTLRSISTFLKRWC